MTYSRKSLYLLATSLVAVALTITCDPVPDYCRPNGQWYDPTCQFCSGGKAYPLCDDGSYNPLTQGCNPLTNTVGTMCADSSFVAPGSLCGGYTLSVGTAPAGGGTVERTPPSRDTFAANESVVLSAAPSSGYAFVGWAGAVDTTAPSVTLTMSGSSGNKPIVAMFRPQSAPGATEHTLATTAFPKGSGTVTVTANGTVSTDEATIHNSGTRVSVTATPTTGYTFSGWSGVLTSALPTDALTMNGGNTLVAIFTPVVHTLTVKSIPEDGGTVYINSTARTGVIDSIDARATVEAYAVPKSEDGYSFAGWSGDAAEGIIVGDKTGNRVTITVDRGGMTLTANFRRDGGTGGPPPPPTVEINGLTWTKENLNINTSDSWCYRDSASYCAKYGRLYTWEAAKSACASMGGGWRLPSSDDWDILVDYAGGSSVAGKKLKSKSGWNDHPETSESGNGTDDYGFSALPGGHRRPDGGFASVGNYGEWWSAENFDGFAYHWQMGFLRDDVSDYSDFKEWGYSVRCVQSNTVTPPPPTTYTLTVSANPLAGGTVSPTSRANISAGTTTNIFATVASGYRFVNWTVTGTGATVAAPNSASTSVIIGTADATVTAVFERTTTEPSLENSIIDPRDGQTYPIVTIGSQRWMGKNLNYPITNTSTDSSWCYGDDPAKCEIYGRLYNWSAATKACPGGWKLPDRNDWNVLMEEVGGERVSSSSDWAYDYYYAGTKLRSKTGWYDGSSDYSPGADEYGFSALPGGLRFPDGYINYVGYHGYWWSAQEYDDADLAYKRGMYNYGVSVGESAQIKESGLSVRCLAQ